MVILMIFAVWQKVAVLHSAKFKRPRPRRVTHNGRVEAFASFGGESFNDAGFTLLDEGMNVLKFEFLGANGFG